MYIYNNVYIIVIVIIIAIVIVTGIIIVIVIIGPTVCAFGSTTMCLRKDHYVSSQGLLCLRKDQHHHLYLDHEHERPLLLRHNGFAVVIE